MLTQDTVAAAARTAGLPPRARFVERTGSTNSDLFRLAAGGAPAWTVLVAGQQEAGRGRLGRGWVSREGRSLLCSVLLRPDLAPSTAPLLSLAAALAMAGACRSACGVSVGCKWPNDLVAGGRKVGGVLAEASVTTGRLDHVVVGTGVNVLQSEGEFPEDLRTIATSVAIEGGRPDLPGLLAAYLLGLRAAYEAVVDGREEEVLARYRERSETLGRRVRAETAAGAIEGTAVGLGPSGELLVQTAEGVRAVGFGEIVHLGR